MKHATVSYHSLPKLELKDLPQWLDDLKVDFIPIDVLNWANDYPYQPSVQFRMVATEQGFVLNYQVSECSVRAVAPQDCGSVWEDSCVEFFSSPADDGFYYNIECNCAGTILVAMGKDRHERTFAPAHVLEGIKRWSSLGRETFDERCEDTTWQVVLLIPYSTYFGHKIEDVRGMRIKANFYKCGDKLNTPHFISWNPIGTPTPDFHCPEYFGELEFEA